MTTFSKSFYTPNQTATRQQAEKRLTESGYSNFEFKGMSMSNGASFYFILADGSELRVSDHPLTGKRAFEVKQISLYPVKKLQSKRQDSSSTFQKRLDEIIAKRNAK